VLLAIQWAKRLLFLFVVEKLFGGWVMFVSMAFDIKIDLLPKGQITLTYCPP